MRMRFESWQSTIHKLGFRRVPRPSSSVASSTNRRTPFQIEVLESRCMLDGVNDQGMAQVPGIVQNTVRQYSASPYVSGKTEIWRPAVSTLDAEESPTNWFLLEGNTVYPDRVWLGQQSNLIGAPLGGAQTSGTWTDYDMGVSGDVFLFRKITVSWEQSGMLAGDGPYSETITFSLLGFAGSVSGYMDGNSELEFANNLDASITAYANGVPGYDPTTTTSDFLWVKLNQTFTYTRIAELEASENGLLPVSVTTDFSATIVYDWDDTTTTIVGGNPSLGTPGVATTVTVDIDGSGNSSGEQSYSGGIISNFTVDAGEDVTISQVPADVNVPWEKSGDGNGKLNAADRSSVKVESLEGDLDTIGNWSLSTFKSDLKTSRDQNYDYNGSGTWNSGSLPNPALDRLGTLNRHRVRPFDVKSNPVITLKTKDRRTAAHRLSLVNGGDILLQLAGSLVPIDAYMLSNFEMTAKPRSRVHGTTTTDRDTTFLAGKAYDVHLVVRAPSTVENGAELSPSEVETKADSDESTRIPVGAFREWSTANSKVISYGTKLKLATSDLIFHRDGNNTEKITGTMSASVTIFSDHSTLTLDSKYRRGHVGLLHTRNGATSELPATAVSYMLAYVGDVGGQGVEFSPGSAPLFPNLHIGYDFLSSKSNSTTPGNRYGVSGTTLEFLENEDTRLTTGGLLFANSQPDGDNTAEGHTLETVWDIKAFDGDQFHSTSKFVTKWDKTFNRTSPSFVVVLVPKNPSATSPEVPTEIPVLGSERDDPLSAGNSNITSPSDPAVPGVKPIVNGYSSTNVTTTSHDTVTETTDNLSESHHKKTTSGLDDEFGKSLFHFVETISSNGTYHDNVRAEFEKGKTTVRRHGDSDTHWNVTSGTGNRETSWERHVNGSPTMDGETTMNPSPSKQDTEYLDKANLASSGNGDGTSNYDLTTVFDDLTVTPDATPAPKDPGHGPWIPDPTLPGYDYTQGNHRTRFYGTADTTTDDKYKFEDKYPEFKLKIDSEQTVNGVPQEGHYLKVHDTGHLGHSTETVTDVASHYKPTPIGFESTQDGSVTATTTQTNRYKIPNNLLLQKRGIELSSFGVTELRVVNGDGREGLNSTDIEITELSSYGTRSVLEPAIVTPNGGTASGETANQTSAGTSTTTGAPGTQMRHVMMGTLIEDSKASGSANESLDVKETRKAKVPAVKWNFNNTEMYKTDNRWDQTLSVVTNHHEDKTGTKSVSLTAAEDKNKFTLTLETMGGQDKDFAEGTVSPWSVKEWRQGTHNSMLTVNEKYSASGTITVGFNADGWTAVVGSIVQTSKSNGGLTSHTYGEGWKEFKRSAYFGSTEEEYGTSSGGGGSGPSSGLVGSGHEIVGQKSTRIKDTSDTFDGHYTTTLSYTLDAGKLTPHEPVDQSNIVQGNQSGTDTYYEKHGHVLTHNGTTTTYGGGYVLKSTRPITGSYGPIAYNKLWFGPQQFGKIGYQGELGQYDMAIPVETAFAISHTTIDPTAGTEPAAFQDPGGTQRQLERYFGPLDSREWNRLQENRRKLQAELEQLSKASRALYFDIQVARMAEAAYVGNDLMVFLESEGWELTEQGADDVTGFAFKLFKNNTTGQYVLAFAGSDDAQDWVNNFLQGFGNIAPQYEQALDTAMQLKEKYRIPDNKFMLTGHSLGGGLASFVSIVLTVRAITFNASGVAQNTVAWYDKTLDDTDKLILAFRLDGDPMSEFQDAWSIPVPYFFWAPWVAPNGVGRKVELFGNATNPLTKHSMHQVLFGMRMLLEAINHRIDEIEKELGIR